MPCTYCSRAMAFLRPHRQSTVVLRYVRMRISVARCTLSATSVASFISHCQRRGRDDCNKAGSHAIESSEARAPAWKLGEGKAGDSHTLPRKRHQRLWHSPQGLECCSLQCCPDPPKPLHLRLSVKLPQCCTKSAWGVGLEYDLVLSGLHCFLRLAHAVYCHSG